MNSSISHNPLSGITKEVEGERAKAYGEEGDSKANSPDVTNLPASTDSQDEGKPTAMDMMNTIHKLAQNLQESMTPVASMSTPARLETDPLISSIKKAAMSIKLISMQLEELTTSLGTFILFPKLPVEIRLQIWREALPRPRVVDVVYDHQYSYETKRCPSRSLRVLRLNQPPPVMLHVCHESRQEALRRYSQIGNIEPTYGLMYSHAFLNLSKDTLFIVLPNSRMKEEYQRDILTDEVLDEGTFQKLKYLAIDIGIWNGLGQWYEELTSFKSLTELSVVDHDQRATKPHEVWRMEPGELELVDVQSGPDARYNDPPEIFEELKANCPKWHEPKFNIKTVVRGGRQCCFVDEDLAML